jgi:hypothetical protein
MFTQINNFKYFGWEISCENKNDIQQNVAFFKKKT